MMSAAAEDAAARGPAPAAGLRPFRFALLCHQRSGSNALAGMLEREETVDLYGQLFNPFLEYGWRNVRHGFGRYRPHPEPHAHFGRRPLARYRIERAATSLFPCERDLGAFMARFYERRSAPSLAALGFKLHDYQLVHADLAELVGEHVDGTVMLWRRNRLKAAVSWAYAVKTDVWSRNRGAIRQKPAIALDIQEIAWFIEKTRREVENWRAILGRSGAPFVELTYEDHVRPRELAGLYAFLGLRYRGAPEFSTQKLADARYAHVINAKAIERALGSSEHGHLFA